MLLPHQSVICFFVGCRFRQLVWKLRASALSIIVVHHRNPSSNPPTNHVTTVTINVALDGHSQHHKDLELMEFPLARSMWHSNRSEAQPQETWRFGEQPVLIGVDAIPQLP